MLEVRATPVILNTLTAHIVTVWPINMHSDCAFNLPLVWRWGRSIIPSQGMCLA